MPQVIPAVAAVVTSVTSAVVAAGPLAVAAFNAVNIAAVVGVGLAVASPLLQPKVGSSGPVGEFKSDPTAPIRGVMGRYAIGGNRILKREWGRTNVYKTFVALLSLGPCQGIDQFEADKLPVAFTQPQGGASGKYAGHMWMTYRGGLPGQPVLRPPQGVFIENPKLTAWTSAHRADGHLTAMWTLAQAEDERKRDLYRGSAEPDPRWIGRWMKVWDPRQDSTYPGGSGSQRRDQWNTWAYSDNPYLHALAWIRGHAKLNADGTVDRTKRIAGVGAPERAIDIANYVEGANIADANGWKIAGEWSTSDDKWQVLAAMLQAGGGVPLNRGAQISCMVNTPRASIYTYTRNDLVGGATVKALKARRDRKNTVVPRYRSEVHGWEIVPAGAVTSSVYRTEDRGEPRTIEIEYSYVTSAKQAGELGAYDVANMREGLETSLPSKPHLLGLRAGDAFTTDLPELGLVAQKFIVQRRAFDPQTGVVTLDVLSETDAKHAWALGQTASPPPTPSLVGVDPDYVAPPELPEWTVVVRPPAGDGSQQPGFEIIGGSPAADASSVVMEHGQSPTGPWKQFYDGALKTTGRVPIDGLQPGETYYVAVRYRRDSSGALSERTIYGPYTAPPLTAGDVSPNAPSLQALDQSIRDAFGEDIGNVQGDLDAAEALIQSQGNEIVAARGGQPSLGARIVQVNKLREDGDGANASAITLVSNEVMTARQGQPTLSARVSQVDQARINGDVANAEVIASQGSEIVAARQGSASMAARLTQIDQARLIGDQAIATSVDEVEARTDQTEAAIIAVNKAVSDEATARASAIDQVTARTTLRGNLVPNSTGAQGMSGWTGSAWAANAGSDVSGPHFYNNTLTQNLVSGYIEGIAGGQAYTLQADIRLAATTGTVRGLIEWFSPSASLGFSPVAFTANAGRLFGGVPLSGQVTAPSTATRARVLFNPQSITGLVSMAVRRIKLEWGALPATGWTDEATVSSLSASVTSQSLAIIDLTTQQALARFELAAQAAGGLPALFRLVSSSLGSYGALIAPVVALLNNIPGGDPLVVMEARNGKAFFARAVSVDHPTENARLIVGPTAGGTILWFGTKSFDADTATRTNARWAFGTDLRVYYGGSELGGGSPSTVLVFQSGAGAGTVSRSLNIGAASKLSFAGSLEGGSLATNEPLYARLTLTASAGGQSQMVGTCDVVLEPNGTQLPGGSWAAQSAGSGTFSARSTITGTPVTYALSVTRTGGANFGSQGSVISGELTILPLT